MTPASSHAHHKPPFRGFELSMERLLGADMRLIYGMAVPVLMVVGLIILLGLNPVTWLQIVIVLLEAVALGVVVLGIMGMMADNDEDDQTTS